MMEEQVIVAQQLVKHPKLFERFKNMLAIVDNDEEESFYLKFSFNLL